METWGFLIEGALFGGAALAWGIWELRSVRREIRKDKEKAAAEAETLSAAELSGHAER